MRREKESQPRGEGTETLLLAVGLFLAALIWFGITVIRG
ncbi:MAG: hypothetical protein DVB23_003012 [Verrucomicrobia bacterium]|jgi:hypothetical protein|nr:MAG: hypothetical protein DVB23_003012 [Verrucomicrobiota bacterium]